MIPRYARPEMTAIWSPETRYAIWLEIETLAMEAMAELGTIPKSAAGSYRKKGKFDVARIDEIEREVKHDVIAFLTNVAEHVGPEARFAHQGMTSSDVLDTCLAVQLTRASGSADRRRRARDGGAEEARHRVQDTPMHRPQPRHPRRADHVRPQARRPLRRILPRSWSASSGAQYEIATCMISGAVGTFAQIDPRVEAYVAEKLGSPEPVSTQVIPRDRHAQFFAVLGVVASSIERLATEIRHLQRTEVLEAEEFFEPGQKGSSAMPHKRNPVLTENLCGLARLVRSAVTPAMENVALWHERDISPLLRRTRHRPRRDHPSRFRAAPPGEA